MPIKGISDILRIPRVGKIHLGIKKTNATGKEYPTATDHFVVKEDDSTSGQAAAAFRSVYGDKPKEISIAFPSDNPDDFFPQWLSSYRSINGRYELYCQGNGETASRVDGQGSRVAIPCMHKDCPIYVDGKCKDLGRLQFFLPEVPGLGCWQLDSTSYHTMVNLNSSIAMIRAFTGGKIKMMPLTLRLVPKVVSPDGKPKTVFVLDLQIENMRLVDFLQQAPMLTAAFSPSVEPIAQDELPEDLYIDDSLVIEETASTNPNPEEAVRNFPINPDVRNNPPETVPAETVSTDEVTDVASYAGREIKPSRKDPQHMIAQLKLAKRDGTMVEVLTDDLTIIADTKTLQKGMTVEYVVKPSSKWTNRLEIVSIVPVA